MSWGAQSRSKDAKTPTFALAMSENPKLALCGIQPYKHYGRSGSFFSFRLKYETVTRDQPSTFRIAAPSAEDGGSTGQCYHIIAGYAPTTAHTNAECEEYYDELDEHIAKKRQNDILIIATDCNANVGNRRSWAKHKPASQMCLGNHGNGRKNTRGESALSRGPNESACLVFLVGNLVYFPFLFTLPWVSLLE